MRRKSKRDLAKREVNALVRNVAEGSDDRRRGAERERGGPAVEQARTGDGRHQGPRAGERGEGPEGGGLEDVFFFTCCVVSVSSRVAWLHGCTERKQMCTRSTR